MYKMSKCIKIVSEQFKTFF